MELQPLNSATASVIRNTRSALRQMTSEQLLHLGVNEVVYLKSAICDGNEFFVLFGADGTPVVAADDVDAAVESAIEHGLSFVAVH